MSSKFPYSDYCEQCSNEHGSLSYYLKYWLQFYFCYIPRFLIGRSYWSSFLFVCFSFLRTLHTVFHGNYTTLFCILTSSLPNFYFFYIFTTICHHSVFWWAILTRVLTYHCDFNFHLESFSYFKPWFIFVFGVPCLFRILAVNRCVICRYFPPFRKPPSSALLATPKPLLYCRPTSLLLSLLPGLLVPYLRELGFQGVWNKQRCHKWWEWCSYPLRSTVIHSDYEIGNMAWVEGLSWIICERTMKIICIYVYLSMCNVCVIFHMFGWIINLSDSYK